MKNKSDDSAFAADLFEDGGSDASTDCRAVATVATGAPQIDASRHHQLFPPCLTAAMRDAIVCWQGDEPANQAGPGPEIHIIDPPPACHCGSLDFWWDLRGNRHCTKCEPPW